MQQPHISHPNPIHDQLVVQRTMQQVLDNTTASSSTGTNEMFYDPEPAYVNGSPSSRRMKPRP